MTNTANEVCRCGHVKVMHPLGVCGANIMGTDPDCECKEFRPAVQAEDAKEAMNG